MVLLCGNVLSAVLLMDKKDVEAIVFLIAISLSLWAGYLAGISHG
jgi:hypothetical protein